MEHDFAILRGCSANLGDCNYSKNIIPCAIRKREFRQVQFTKCSGA